MGGCVALTEESTINKQKNLGLVLFQIFDRRTKRRRLLYEGYAGLIEDEKEESCPRGVIALQKIQLHSHMASMEKNLNHLVNKKGRKKKKKKLCLNKIGFGLFQSNTLTSKYIDNNDEKLYTLFSHRHILTA